MADIPSRMNDIDSSLRMAGRVPQYFLGSDPAVPGVVVDGAVLPPASELNHLPYPGWPLVANIPIASGIRSGEIPLSDEVAVPLQDSAVDQSPRYVPKIIVQPASIQQPIHHYGVGGEVLNYYQYEDSKGIWGDGRLASGNFSDTSGISDKHAETASRGFSSANSSMGEQPGQRIKLMCSFGGKILPRPGDGKLRYVGGETRIVSVRRHITYADLMRKMMQLYGQAVTMKYQLPDEDLDALISVSSDEDLENMMEEYDRLEAGEGNPRIRSFLFSSSDYDAVNLSDSGERKSTDLMYVDAINGLSEPRSSVQLDSVSANTSNNSTGFRAADAWNASPNPEIVPVGVLAPTVFQGTASSVMHSLPVGIASHNKPVLSRIPSAPPSAPSSPPVFSQAPQIRQFPISDISYHVSPDHPPVKAHVGQPYEMQRLDGNYHDVEGVGSATSSVNSQHDSAHGALEPRRVVDSPTKAQQEISWAQEPHELLRTADSVASRADSQSILPRPDSHGRMPKVGSHGKLIPSQEQLVEVGAPLFAGENQLSNMIHPPTDLQTFGVQPQPQVPKTALQHSLEALCEGYQRMDPMQQSAPENIQAQQQALHQRQQIVSQAYPPVCMDPMQQTAAERILPQALPYYQQPIVSQFYSPRVLEQLQQSAVESLSQQQASRHRQQYASQLYAPVGQEVGAFTQAEQPLQQDDALTSQIPFKSVALQTPVNPLRMGAVSATVSQLASSPLASVVAFQGNNLKQGDGQQYFPGPGGVIDPPYARIAVQPNNELVNRILKPPNIPLDSREQQRYIEDQIARDKAAMPFVSLEQKPQENKADTPLRKHELLQPQSHYSDELRRPVIPPYPGVSTYQQEGLVHFIDHGILRREKKEHAQQHEDEEFAPHLQYQGGVDWSTQNMYNDHGEMISGWTQKGQFDTQKELTAETASSEIFGKPAAKGVGLHVLEPSVGGAAAGDSHSAVENTGNQFDPAGRPSVMPSVVTSRMSTLPSTMYSDSPQPTYLPVRVESDGLPKLAITQQGAAALDTALLSSHETRHANVVSFVTQQMPDDKAAGLGPSVHTGSPLSPPSNVLPSAVLAKMEEGRWTEDFESDRLSANNSGRHSNEGAFDTSTTLSSDGGLKRPTSGDMIASPEDLLGVSIVSKNCSNKSSTDEGAFVPPFNNMQSMVPNGISYPTGSNTWGMGLDAFQTNVNLPLPTCISTAEGLSTTNPSFPLMVDAVMASSSLAQAGKDSSHGKKTVSRQREELLENAHAIADPFVDKTGLINAPSMAPFDPVQVSKGLDEKGLFPIFDSDSLRESETAEFEDEKIKGDLEHVAKDVAAAVLQPAPTLSIQNWEDTLANVETEETVTKESLLNDESLDEVKLHVGEKVVTFQEKKTESKEGDKDGLVANKPTNVAVIAEEDAIALGLQTIKNSDLEELRELGSGTFGTVYHGKWRGTDVAIKRIKSSCFTGRPSERERLIADFWREAYILGQLHHPNVVAFYGVVRDGPGGTLATVTEYMVNGSLKQFLQKKDRAMDRRKRFSIIMDAAFGMEYLHGKNIVHFDLKCENLLVNMRDAQRPICKVGDLGLSKVKHQTMVSGGVRGTLPWMAPELLNGSSSLVSEKVDVFSFGIVMWELLTGEEPYANMHYGAIIGGIVNNTLRPTVPSNCEQPWKSLMERCWSAEPGERPSFSEIASELRAMASSTAAKGQGQAPPAGSG